MRYGHFDDAALEYVVERPDTPRPWSNYLGSRKYGGVVTNHGGGYSFTESPAQGRFIRHRYNAIPYDMPGRQFYLRDRDSGDFWSHAWQPVGKPLDQYASTCRFGTNYTVVDSAYAGIAMETTYFVPLGQMFEYWWMKVTNTGGTPRRLSVFSFCEFTCEWNMVNDLLNLQYVQYIARARFADGFVHASSVENLGEKGGDFANRDQGRFWWMTQVGGRLVGHDCERDTFVGVYNSFHNPAAVVAGKCFGSDCYSDNPCGAIQSDIELQPGESVDVIVMLGVGPAHSKGVETRAKFGSAEAAALELRKLKDFWHSKIRRVQVDTPDPAFNHMVNVWNAYNSLITFEWCRAFSLVYTGDQRDGFGYRDAVLDCNGVSYMLPGAVRERLILMLAAQESNGGAQPEVRAWIHKPGQMPPTPKEHFRSDDCQWLFEAIPAYVDETGDRDFYRTVVPYADKGEATVLGHLRRALEFNLERAGRNGLPCGLSADWNDCLKLGYLGESVFVTFQVRRGLVRYAAIARNLGEDAEAAWAGGALASLDKRIQSVCWDGEWFIWAIGQNGTVYGTKALPDGQVYINTQAWGVLSGAATPEQTQVVLDTMDRRLATPYGLKLCDPACYTMDVETMRAMLFNPGNKENGGIFSHPQSWAVLAEVAAGDGDRAYRYYRAFMPAAQNDMAEHRVIEPFVHCQSTHAQPSPKFGTSRVPWLSGTASWATFTALQGILGLIPELDGFRIDPCIPREWPGFSAVRRFRGKTLKIVVRNPHGKDRGVKSLTVNGRMTPGNVIPLDLLTDETEIVAEM